MTIKYRQQLGDLLKFMNLPLVIAEVGVAEGLFAKQIMDWGTQTLYLIDMWETHGLVGDGSFAQEWHDDNLQQVQSRMAVYDHRPEQYVILQGDSAEMATHIPDNSLSMVYIDADHSYEGVKRDIEAFYPKVISGGLIAFHDYLSPDYGVQQAVTEFCTANNYIPVIIPETGIMDAGAYFIKH